MTHVLAGLYLTKQIAGGWTAEVWTNLIQAVGTIAALLGVIVTLIYAARTEKRESARARADAEAQREDAEHAANAADRAENAARLTLDAMGRIVDALDVIAAKDLGTPSVIMPSEPERVRWSLEHFQGDRYILKNVGNATAYDVHVSAHPSLMTPQELPMAEDVGPDGNLTFMASASLGTTDKTITVQWADSESDALSQTWRYPLPPRPLRTR